MNKQQFLKLTPALQSLLKNADHIDIKTEAAPISLRAFIAGALSYHPWWLKALYAIRYIFVRLLGMKQEGASGAFAIKKDDVSMRSGDWVSFFQVKQAKAGHYWVGEASDKHLTAYLAVVVNDSGAERLFHLATVVHYHHWTGPVYFNVIRPFHHIVVRAMMQAAAEPAYSLE